MTRLTRIHDLKMVDSLCDLMLTFVPLGMYWIDPNGGTVKDAIWVYCDESKKSSCVYPKNALVICSREHSLDAPPPPPPNREYMKCQFPNKTIKDH